MKKTLALLLALAMVFALAACGSTQTTPAAEATEAPAAETPAEAPAASDDGLVERPQESYIWGSASMGGSAQMVITAIGTLINDKDPYLNINVQSTGGSMENPRLLRAGEIDIAHTGEPYNAYNGLGRFAEDGKMPEDTMVLMKTYAAGMFFVVKSDSPIKTIDDMKGKSLYLGPPGGAVDQIMRLLEEGYGITEENTKFVMMGYSESIDALKDGTVDAAVVQSAGSQPASVTSQLDETCDVRPVAFSEEVLKELNSNYPDYGYYILKAGTLKNQTEDIPVTCTWNTQLCNAKLSEQAAYEICKLTFENIPELATAHSLCGELDKNDPLYGVPMDIPIHPGAARYYEEIGVLGDHIVGTIN